MRWSTLCATKTDDCGRSKGAGVVSQRTRGDPGRRLRLFGASLGLRGSSLFFVCPHGAIPFAFGAAGEESQLHQSETGAHMHWTGGAGVRIATGVK